MRGSTVLLLNDNIFVAKLGLDLLICSHLLFYWLWLKSKINMATQPKLLSLLLLFSYVKLNISTNLRCKSFVTLEVCWKYCRLLKLLKKGLFEISVEVKVKLFVDGYWFQPLGQQFSFIMMGWTIYPKHVSVE